jgi:hypothetical protein
MNKEQEQIMMEAYRQYSEMSARKLFKSNTYQEFINKCKTDTELAERWGLKFEERELSRDERIDLYCEEHTPGIRGKYVPPFDDFIDDKLKTWNIPTKLITITYKDTIIESYE